MSYCGNCGTELPAGARFCAACGTPVPADHGSIMNAMPYPSGGQGGVPYQNKQADENMPAYSHQSVYGHGSQIHAGSQIYGNAQPPYANGPEYGNDLPPYAGGQAYGEGLPPYAGGQAYGEGLPPYAEGQIYGNVQSPYAGGQMYGGGLPPYAEGQIYGNVQSPYAGGQAYGGGLPPYAEGPVYENGLSVYGYCNELSAAGEMCAGNYYDPYGRLADLRPRSSQKRLMTVCAVVGLIIAAVVILLIVLLTSNRGNRSYEQAVSVFMDGFERQDLSRISEAFPERAREDIWREMGGSSRYAQMDVRSEADSEDDFWQELNADLEWYCGGQITMTYEITGAEPITDYRLCEYERHFLEDFQYEVSFDGGFSVNVEITFQGNEGDFRSSMKLNTAMIGKNWYVIDPVVD